MVGSSYKYRHFIFDFDGVICDSLESAMNVFNQIQKDHFPTLPNAYSQDDMKIVYSGSLRTCLQKWLSEDESKKFFDLHSAEMSKRTEKLKTFPGIGKVLTSLGNQNVSIVTSAYSEAVEKILAEDKDYDKTCLYKIAGRELRQTKTVKINEILNGLGLTSKESIYVGDLESDILYCRDVPIDIVAVGYGYHPGEYLLEKKPTFYVDSVKDLGTLLNRLSAQ